MCVSVPLSIAVCAHLCLSVSTLRVCVGITPLAHCIRPLTDLIDFALGRSRNALWVLPFRRLHRLRSEVEKILTFQAATDPSANQIKAASGSVGK